ncbi:ArsR family transcriptional regulator [Pseudonocardia sp. TRM90224]|uniref:ArsR family transcriptional regulator n=1 Tax=Pseudonocardia sp. TRM90224 TaxID=2812678 RepID=UPI001E54A3C3|nr:ArsR family transcriptional regulator [Pseudonocardia sp. TRM90224]
MGWWRISADTLAQARFVLSPLAETIASVQSLVHTTAAHPGEQAWLDAHLPAYRQRTRDEPIGALIMQAGLRLSWNADFLTPTPTADREHTFDEEVAVVRRTPPDAARADLEVALNGPLPAELRRSDLPEHAAELYRWVWEETVLPYWPARRRTLEADVVARTSQLATKGWAGTIVDLRPQARWLGEGRLQINAYEYPPRDVDGSTLVFVPVTLRRRWVTWTGTDRYAIIYPCSGALVEPGNAAVPAALGALLGPARAAVLVLVETPKSTTQLVALTGQALGSVGRHLKILLDAGLVRRRRSGRSVLYYRAAPGDAVVAAAASGAGGAWPISTPGSTRGRSRSTRSRP